MAGLVRMLEKPDTREALDQLRMVKTSSLGNLIAFMHVYNLRFGAATTPHQRVIYDQLYPLLDEVRDRIMKESNADDERQPLAPMPIMWATSLTSWISIHCKEKTRRTPSRQNPTTRDVADRRRQHRVITFMAGGLRTFGRRNRQLFRFRRCDVPDRQCTDACWSIQSTSSPSSWGRSAIVSIR